jgi:V/A-type H+-transporting ATPase subunit K
MNRKALLFVLILVTICFAAVPIFAQEEPQQAAAQEPKKRDITVALIAAAAAIAVGLCALATAHAQARIGAAGAGTIAEKPESAGSIILMVAIPETMVILGFVVAVVMLFTL